MFGKKRNNGASLDDLDKKLAHYTEVEQYIRTGKLILAIKLYRRDTGASLADAKAAVERIQANLRQPFSSAQDLDDGELEDTDIASQHARTEAALEDAVQANIESMLIQGHKIQAIKLYRQQTGVGLQQAKSAVDRLESQLLSYGSHANNIGSAGLSAAQDADDPYGPAAFNARTSQSLDEEVRNLLWAGKKIEAIKLYRQRTGLGLAQAKAAIDRLEQ